MKTIKLKVYKEEIGGRPTFLTTYDLLKTAINQQPQGGFSIDEMQVRLRLLGIIDAHKQMFDIKEGEFTDELLEREVEVNFEDADFDKLKTLYRETKWGAVSSTIVEVSNSLR